MVYILSCYLFNDYRILGSFFLFILIFSIRFFLYILVRDMQHKNVHFISIWCILFFFILWIWIVFISIRGKIEREKNRLYDERRSFYWMSERESFFCVWRRNFDCVFVARWEYTHFECAGIFFVSCIS